MRNEILFQIFKVAAPVDQNDMLILSDASQLANFHTIDLFPYNAKLSYW
jgi:hypothetical protein